MRNNADFHLIKPFNMRPDGSFSANWNEHLITAAYIDGFTLFGLVQDPMRLDSFTRFFFLLSVIEIIDERFARLLQYGWMDWLFFYWMDLLKLSIKINRTI